MELRINPVRINRARPVVRSTWNLYNGTRKIKIIIIIIIIIFIIWFIFLMLRKIPVNEWQTLEKHELHESKQQLRIY